MTRILVVDNYDSFVFNLVQYLQQLGAECTVFRNDEVEAVEAQNFDGVLISPGPGTPEEAGVSVAMINYCAQNSIPLFGVCLGHQAIGVAFGATAKPPVWQLPGVDAVLQLRRCAEHHREGTRRLAGVAGGAGARARLRPPGIARPGCTARLA